MRIGIVCYPTVGGSGVVATEVAHALADSGHEVHLLSYDRPSRLRDTSPRLHFHEVSVTAYPLFRYPPYDLALATRMLEVSEEAKIDLFHVHYAIPHAVSAFLARSMLEEQGARGCKPLRFVTTLHGTDITLVGSDRAYLRPTRFAIEQSDAVTAVSHYLAEETKRTFGVECPVEVVPNFVDTKTWYPKDAERYYDRGNEERILIHVSNFRPVKRTADIVRAFAAIQRQVPARLWMVGDGPDCEHAFAVAADLGVATRVEHRGVVDDLERMLPKADLFLSASETESFGLSMLEAMSCGVPCVSTAVGGVEEVLGDTGVLTPFGEPDAMAAAALRLLTDPAEHARRSRAARSRAIARFSADDVIARYVRIYERILQ